MELLSKDDFFRLTKDKTFPINKLGELLMKIFKLDRINELYHKIGEQNEQEFIDSLIELLGVSIQFDESELKKIPKKGPFIVTSNHPLGILDVFLLLKVIGNTRSDFKLMVHELFSKAEPLKDKIIPIFSENSESPSNSVAGLRKGLNYLNEGGCIGLLPAGEVSSFNFKGKISDKEWDPKAIKYIQKAQVPVVPVYIHGSNSLLFHLMDLAIPNFKNARLASELLNKKSQSIRIRIGNPIKPQEQALFEDTELLGRFLRSKTYALGSALSVSSFFPKSLPINMKKPEPIAEAISAEELEKEIRSLHPEHFVLELDQYKMFLAPAEKIPNMIMEIGRQREITYREVGEGSNKSLDLDEYDIYYKHLFLWDSNEKQIVGAYRLGLGPEIFPKYNAKGFYIHSLFKILSGFEPILEQTLELGRSFVAKAYQRKPQPLFLLWKGILYTLMNNPELRYIIGPVSISDQYSKRSKQLIAAFFYNYYFDQEKSKFIKPRNKYVFKISPEDELFMKSIHDDMNKLDRLIEDLEPSQFKVPVLIKKYIKQNAKILGFNLDPKFSDVLDAFMIMDMKDLPASSFEKLSRDLEQNTK